VSLNWIDATHEDRDAALRSLADAAGAGTQESERDAPPVPATRYARCGDNSVAYKVFGDGPVDLVMVPGFISHIEHEWTFPGWARLLRGMGEFARVIKFDKMRDLALIEAESLPANSVELKLATELRGAALRADVFPEIARKFEKPLKYASARGARLMAILGENERAKGEVSVRDLTTREQTAVRRAGAAPAIAALARRRTEN